MPTSRVICFIDGFNLYHAIDNLKEPYLKWVNLWKLAGVFIPKSQQLIDVFYFSAYMDWRAEKKKRHIQYVKALVVSGVKPIMGQFKNKDKKCPKCKHEWCGHEEKESDVNMALTMLDLAYQNKYDRALLITNDSDLAPAINIVRANFPEKHITTIAPPHYFHSNELIKASTDKAKITKDHLKRCQLDDNIYDVGGNLLSSRPIEYALPTDVNTIPNDIESACVS